MLKEATPVRFLEGRVRKLDNCNFFSAATRIDITVNNGPTATTVNFGDGHSRMFPFPAPAPAPTTTSSTRYSFVSPVGSIHHFTILDPNADTAETESPTTHFAPDSRTSVREPVHEEYNDAPPSYDEVIRNSSRY